MKALSRITRGLQGLCAGPFPQLVRPGPGARPSDPTCQRQGPARSLLPTPALHLLVSARTHHCQFCARPADAHSSFYSEAGTSAPPSLPPWNSALHSCFLVFSSTNLLPRDTASSPLSSGPRAVSPQWCSVLSPWSTARGSQAMGSSPLPRARCPPAENAPAHTGNGDALLLSA